MKRKKNKVRPKRPEYDKLVFDVLHRLAGKSSHELAKQSFLTASTIAKIRRGPAHGGTRHPWSTTLAELARLSGGELRFIEQINDTEKPPELDKTNLVVFKPRKKG